MALPKAEIEKHLNSLLPDVRELLDKPKEERIKAVFTHRFIKYPKAVEILEYLELLLSMPKQVRPECMLLYGESGTGKTSIIRQFQKMHPPVEDPFEEEDLIPVLVVETPFEPKVSLLYDRILYEIGVPYKTTENIVVKENRIEFYVNKLGIRMLIMDEFHNILNGSASQQRKVLSAIKSLTNTLRIPIVLSGTRDALIAVESEDETKRRFFPKYLPKWKKDKDFVIFLKSVERTLPLKRPSYLWKDEKIIDYLLDKSDGILADVLKLIKHSAKKAIEEEKERIDFNLLKSVDFFDREFEKALEMKDV